MMQLRIRTKKDNEDMYVILSNHIPQYKEFIDIGEHRFIVEYVTHVVDDTTFDVITDVIIYVKEIY